MKRDFSRQSFLGELSEATIASAKVGIIGLGGGGSHIVQQLAHIGIQDFVLIDPDIIENSNLNRLVSGTTEDVLRGLPKAEIAARTIRNISRNAKIVARTEKWQVLSDHLKDCVVIFGCVDSYSEREQLERFCRRFLVHYIDIGMDVLKFESGHRIVGQVVTSSPGWCCLRCIGFLTDEKLRLEANAYGEAGPRPQVVWSNGILASAAVGLFMRALTPWAQLAPGFAYLEYNGNDCTLTESPIVQYAIALKCSHFNLRDLGDPLFDITR